MLRSLEILGILLFRFRAMPRAWVIVLIIVNLGSLFFLDTQYGQINLLAVLAGMIVMVVIYARLGFVRLLGIGHIFWLPMLVWFLSDLPDQEHDPMLFYWVLCLILFNSLSLVIDAIDVVRFVGGDRKPYYVWRDEGSLKQQP
ncbi:MAG: hypothetical protein ACR2OW_02325 [Methyloligellaceae bacterium]